MPPKDQGPPGDSRSPNEHKKVALHERAKLTTAQQREQTLAAALRIARFGIAKQDRESGRAVFPVRSSGPRAKQPHVSAKHSNGRPWGATTDPVLIGAYWKKYPDADIGMVTGDGLFVLDVDSVEGHGVDGFASFAALEQNIGSVGMTRRMRTPSGGEQFLFSAPNGVRVPCSTSKLGPGLDIRGDGGYVVVPSSSNYNDTGRSWLTLCDPAPAPPGLLDLVADRRGSPSRRVGAATRPSPGASPVSIDPALSDKMAVGGRNGVSTDPADSYPPDDDPLKATCALSVIPADPYGDWVEIGMALFAALCDSEDPEVRARAAEIGYEIFDAWSKTSKKYDADAVRKKWFEECVNVHSLGAGTLYRAANELDPRKRWLKTYKKLRARRAK